MIGYCPHIRKPINHLVVFFTISVFHIETDTSKPICKGYSKMHIMCNTYILREKIIEKGCYMPRIGIPNKLFDPIIWMWDIMIEMFEMIIIIGNICFLNNNGGQKNVTGSQE